MDYLAIRDNDCKNVYYYKTKGEKGRILSKFPNASNRVFLETEKDAAMAWAGVDRIATEEENLWAITKQPKVVETKEIVKEVNEKKEEIKKDDIQEDIKEVDTNKKDNIVENESFSDFLKKGSESFKNNSMTMFLDKMTKTEDTKTNKDNVESLDIKSSGENKTLDENVIKHVMSDFEKIIEIYKKNGIKLLEITLIGGERYCLITDDLYYISNFGTLPINLPFSSLNEKDLKDMIISIVDEKKANGEKNVSFNLMLSLDMFEKINKTKYLAFGDLVYASDLNFVEQDRISKDEIHYSLKNEPLKKHITFHTSSILNIKPVDTKYLDYIVREKEFSTYIKRALKQLEKQKLKELELQNSNSNKENK